jgi:transcriptional regulator with XRE-family HTH domain
MTIGERILKLRTDNNVTQDELALKINVSRQTIYKWENNVVLPTVDNIVLIADFFNVTTDFILKSDSNKKKNKTLTKDIFVISLTLLCGLLLSFFTWKRVYDTQTSSFNVSIYTLFVFYLVITILVILFYFVFRKKSK